MEQCCRNQGLNIKIDSMRRADWYVPRENLAKAKTNLGIARVSYLRFKIVSRLFNFKRKDTNWAQGVTGSAQDDVRQYVHLSE